MVGVRTSNRCDNCRIRKKKCDERMPSCTQCVLSGWACPGYKIQWKFMDETSRLAAYYSTRKYVYEVVGSDYEKESPQSSSDPEFEGTLIAQTFDRSHLDSVSELDMLQSGFSVPRYLESNRLGSALVYCLDGKVQGRLMPLWISGSFFQFVPARLGYNSALDDAISCLVSIYRSSPSVPYEIDKSIYQGYAKALASLRACLSDSAVNMDSETLCATILLQTCELIVNVDRGEWSELARGTALLLGSRGPSRYTSPFDHAMLESQTSNILSQSMRFAESCFLSEPEWQALLLQSSIWPFKSLFSHVWRLRSRLHMIIVHFPDLMLLCSKVQSDNSATKCEFAWTSAVTKASSMLSSIKIWLTEAESLYASLDHHQLKFPATLHAEGTDYPDLIAGILDCVAHTSLLTVDDTLRALLSAMPTTVHDTSGIPILDDTETVDRWRDRATTAFEFVKARSTLAAKPLDFGLRQIQRVGSGTNGIIEVLR